MRDVLKELLDLLNLENLKRDVYVGQSQDLGWGRVYGGQVIAQSMVAAQNTIETGDDRAIHSLHAYFLLPGDTNAPIEYRVERVRDGGSFSSRRVVAHQHDKPIFMMSASFQTFEEGLDHEFEMPELPGPGGLISELELRRKGAHLVPEKIRQQYTCDRPFEVRPIEPINPFDPEQKPPAKYTWVRAVGPMPNDPTINKCVLAYTSDWGLAGTAMLPHGVSSFANKMQVVSLDHAMWFHRDFKMDEWLLYTQDSPSASRGRGFNRGNFYTQEGQLVASVTQEALIRLQE